MKYNGEHSTSIHDIGFDKFVIHIWSNLQLKIYKEICIKNKVPTISFDATGGCCKKIKRIGQNHSGPIYLYEGIMKIKNKSFTALSMLSEQHDNISTSLWLKRWLRSTTVIPPKVVISDQSLALMSALVQSFTQYNSLEQYLNICFLILKEKNNSEQKIPTCFIRNDVNHFFHLVNQWQPLKTSKYPRTKQLFCRAMCLLIFCKNMDEANKILESIFIIPFSKYDGPCINASNIDDDREVETKTACAQSKIFLQSLITSTSSTVDNYDHEILENYDEDINVDNVNVTSFKDWAREISRKCETLVENVIGEYDNAQYLPELVPIIINTMKLFPCWSSIMVNIFGFGDQIASSSRCESNFNHLKNRVCKNEALPIRVDSFVEHILKYYQGDHLLLDALSYEELPVNNPLRYIIFK